MTSMKMTPPILTKGKAWERYKQELEAWQALTNLEKKQQGVAILLTGLPEDHESAIRDKVFDELGLDKLKVDGGFDALVEFLGKHLGKDDLADSFDKFLDFENCEREKDQSVTDFIAKFDQKYNKIAKLDMNLPSSILAFKLLQNSG